MATRSKPDKPPVCAVVGADRFLRRLALQRVLGQIDDMDDWGPVRMDGTAANLAEVLDEVRTPSLLGSRRVVIVEDADALISAHRAALERYVADPATTGTLILLCDSMPRNTRLYKAIDAGGLIAACEPLKGRALIGWIGERAFSEYGKRLGGNVAQRLRDHLGDDPGRLDAELGKLATFVGTREEIAAADIDAVTGNLREEKVFAVTDAIASGDTAMALRGWEQVLSTDRAAPARAIAGLAWGIRRLLQARRDWENGTSVYELSRRLFADPGVVERRLKQADVPSLERQLQDLLAADLAIKTGASTIEVAIEKFIVTHAQGGRRSPVATAR